MSTFKLFLLQYFINIQIFFLPFESQLQLLCDIHPILPRKRHFCKLTDLIDCASTLLPILDGVGRLVDNVVLRVRWVRQHY